MSEDTTATAVEVPPAPEGVDTTEKSSKVAQKRNLVRLEVPEGGFLEVPAEYDSNKHTPPRKKDFANPITWHQWKMSINLAENAKHQESIDMYEKFGTDEDSLKKAKQFNRSIQTLTELAKDLPTGVDLRSVLGDLADLLSPKA